MRSKRWRALAALTAAAALSLSACGGGGGSNGGDNGGTSATPSFNAAMTKVYNPSDAKGGIIKFANSSDWDTLDPGETYYGYSWNFARLYGRSLLMFRAAPGEKSSELVPDLATSLGKASQGGKTWTYHIRKGVKFDDGTEVKAQDVKYAVERSIDKETFPNGPAYFDAMLNWPNGYKGPYKSPNTNTDSAIETPDDYTIVFHLKQPFAGFDYLAQLTQTMPVPQDKDTGATYKNKIVSTGPYMFDQMQPGKHFTLKRNPEWDQSTDPNRKALPDGYDVQLNVNADDIDNRMIAGDLDVAVQGIGVTPASRAKVLGDPNLKAQLDDPTVARLQYVSIAGTVKPFDNVHCRRAVEYGMDRTSYQTAYGGSFAGGQLATTILPPQIPGYQKFDLYPAGAHGNVAKAKQELKKCGKPNGFSTNMAYRNDRPQEKATAEAFQQALGKIGIKLELRGFTTADYFSSYAGNPPYVVKNNLGLSTNSWGADWNDGFGFLSQIVDSRVIRETGGSSNISVRIPQVDKMVDKASVELNDQQRTQDWGAIDKRVMQDAYIYPGLYGKVLLLRPSRLTNVFVNDSFGMYDYMSFGVQQ
jgi:peptide/nickel transport system substrate-binding protein